MTKKDFPLLLGGHDQSAIEQAALALRAGHLIGLPTETVYGLAADATSPQAIAKIYAAKGRPHFNPLIVHVDNLEDAARHGVFSSPMMQLATRFWPGPLTLVVPVRPDSPVAELARAGLSTIALRVPAHPVARAVIKAAGVPLAAPSANRSGHVTATTAAHVLEDIGEAVALILDAGSCQLGLESTILGEDKERIFLLRSGSLERAAIESVIGRPLFMATATKGEVLAPGMLIKHYAPASALRLEAIEAEPGEAVLDFGPTAMAGIDSARLALNLSAKGDMVEAAANLFSHLRHLDGIKAKSIAVAPIPMLGLGEAINDRLARAAAGR